MTRTVSAQLHTGRMNRRSYSTTRSRTGRNFGLSPSPSVLRAPRSGWSELAAPPQLNESIPVAAVEVLTFAFVPYRAVRHGSVLYFASEDADGVGAGAAMLRPTSRRASHEV